MDAIWTKLAAELPTVVVFVLFVLIWTDRMQKAQDKRGKEFTEALRDATNGFSASLDKQNEHHDLRQSDSQTFYAEMRQKDAAITGQLVEAVEKLSEVLEAHDKDMRNAVAKMEERTKGK